MPNHCGAPCSSEFDVGPFGWHSLDDYQGVFRWRKTTNLNVLSFNVSLKTVGSSVSPQGPCNLTVARFASSASTWGMIGHDPNQASEVDVRKYLLFVTEAKKWSSSTETSYKSGSIRRVSQTSRSPSETRRCYRGLQCGSCC